MEVKVSQQAHGTKTLPRFTDYNVTETNHNTVSPFHKYGCSPSGPFDSSTANDQHLPSSENIFQPLQKMENSGLQCSGYNSYSKDESHSQQIHRPLSFGQGSRRLKYYAPKQRGIVHFSKTPKDGDIFCSHSFDNVLILDFVSREIPQERLTQPSSVYPKERDLYLVQEKNGMPTMHRIGDKVFTFHEENTSATYYLPDKDIALHFARIPKDGDFFCGQRFDNVVKLDAFSLEGYALLNEQPRDRDLYQVHEVDGGMVLTKIDKHNLTCEEVFLFGGATEEENSTFTYYLHDSKMAFHFTKLPVDGVIFRSHQKKNVMILDMFPPENFREFPKLCSYGSPWDVECFRVQQKDDGFELVRIILTKVCSTPEDVIRRKLKIRRSIASDINPAKDNVCAVCLVAYKDFDRIGSMDCGHEYHVSCIVPWLRQNRFCFICKKKFCLKSLN